VQGVGFRPFVYALASDLKLTGEIRNDTKGVRIFLNATEEILSHFVERLQNELPPLASIHHIEVTQVLPKEFEGFFIVSSDQSGEHTAGIPPDTATCAVCKKELFDSSNRRYRYPFITCTHCGPRYSIIYDLPYDRPNTSMRFFAMCDECRREYADPLDRRYHAQPIGCWECGPVLSLWDKNEALSVKREALLDVASQFLLDGKILAVKGVGGYHLMCDATNEEAVGRLRERKRRPHKPFAVMVNDMKTARLLAQVSDQEEALLLSKERPIVLLQAKSDAHRHISMDAVAPGLDRIGLFLPYTPLHLLLLEGTDRPLVATSANMTDEPLCTTCESLGKLAGVYDYVLDHDRKIVNGCDDSVVTAVEGQTVVLRRARGYAPASVKLPFRLPQKVLSMGANQKNTVAIGFDDTVILSPHIGDLDGIASVTYYEKNIETLRRIYNFTPEVIVHDQHPGYESTKLAKQNREKLPLREIQHHHAHILGVMAEKGIEGKVFGVAFDGTGYGEDGALWGGEFLVCDYEGFERAAHLKYFKLLGGEKAIKEPRRVALSLLFECFGDKALEMKTPSVQAFSRNELHTAYTMWQKGLNAPLSSSMGRLFDAVASLVGVCQMMSFEGQSGMLLEMLYDPNIEGSYPFEYKDGAVDIAPMIKTILEEQDIKTAVTKFFHTIVEMIATVYSDYQHLPLVLSGGVFQNRVLLSLMLKRFPKAMIPNDFPPNDGGIALGQAVYRG